MTHEQSEALRRATNELTSIVDGDGASAHLSENEYVDIAEARDSLFRILERNDAAWMAACDREAAKLAAK